MKTLREMNEGSEVLKDETREFVSIIWSIGGYEDKETKE